MSTTSDIEAVAPRRPSTEGDQPHDVVLFDGVCNLCNGWVRFVIERDPDARFRFAPLQSDAATELIPKGALPDGTDSIILIRSGRIYTRSAAVLRIAARLRRPWPLLAIFLIIPPFIRDFVYDVVARNRYQWFGRQDACMLPTPELRSRFLGWTDPS